MNQVAPLILLFLLARQVLVQAQGFVFPVGDPLVRPQHAFPNSNGYTISGDFADEKGHTGVDLANGEEGGQIHSIGHGTVSLRIGTANSAGFGNVVVIRHDLPEGTFYSLYATMRLWLKN